VGGEAADLMCHVAFGSWQASAGSAVIFRLVAADPREDARAASNDIGAAMGLNDPAGPGGHDEDLPGRVAAAGASADPVRDYLRQIGKVPLLNAGQEVELAKRIEAGLFAGQKLADGSQSLSAEARTDLEQVAEDGRTAKDHLVQANLRREPERIDAVIRILTPLRDAWKQAVAASSTIPA